jgi:adenylylsulfate kinase
MSNPLKVGQRSSSENIVWHEASFSRGSREAQRVHRSAILWFTGLLGGGKSTFANAVNQRLFQLGHLTYVLDDDSIRHGLWNDLRFSYTDRVEIIRKIGQVAKLVFGFGVIELTVLVSPFISDREGQDLLSIRLTLQKVIATPLYPCVSLATPKAYIKKREWI